MLDIEKLDDEVLESLQERFSDRASDEETALRMIRNLSPKKAFDEYCCWHGIIGYGNQLWDAVRNLKEAKVEE